MIERHLAAYIRPEPARIRKTGVGASGPGTKGADPRVIRGMDVMGTKYLAFSGAWTLLLAIAFGAAAGLPQTAAAQQQLSEKAVKTFMEYAWSLTPQKFTKPDGKSVLIDKSKRDEVTVPVNKAREVIMAGRLTAHAQICELPEDQVRNYGSLMRRENQLEESGPSSR